MAPSEGTASADRASRREGASRRRPSARAPAEGEDPVDAALAGFWSAQALYAVVELGVAEALGGPEGTPVALADLADDVGVDPGRLYRVLRALEGYGLVRLGASAEDPDDPTVALTDAGAALRKGARADEITDHVAGRYLRPDDVLEALRSGTTAFHRRFGEEMFEHLEADEAARRLFTSAMTGMARHTVPEVVDALRGAGLMEGVGRVVDVGGGEGSLLIALLRTWEDVDGVLFDRPQVLQQARMRVQMGGLADRCEVVPGDFFEAGAVPAGGDLYLLGHVLHDFDDDRAVEVLARCREAMAGEEDGVGGGDGQDPRLIVLEEVVPDGPGWSRAKVEDLMMMVITGGRERTEAEYARLFERAGLAHAETVPTEGALSLVVARLAERDGDTTEAAPAHGSDG